MINLSKSNPLGQCQLKFASDGDTGVFEGYASVFNQNDQVNDTIMPGAFSKSLEENSSPKMFINHDHYEIPVGKWTELKEDDHGLYGIGKINMSHRDGKTLHSALLEGDMDGLSIGFTIKNDDFTMKDDSGRVIHNLSLKEISVVTFPCDDHARITGVKQSDIETLDELKQFEAYLRDGGYSWKEAKTFVSRLLKYALEKARDELSSGQRTNLSDVLKTMRENTEIIRSRQNDR